MAQADTTPKDLMARILSQQPDDSSYEELLRELAFGQMIERGLADLRAGRTLSHEQMKKEAQSWRK